MKVLMLSKACYVATYRRKLEELAALPQVELTLVVPPYWRMGKGRALLEPGYDKGYEMIIENPLLNSHHHLHFYPRFAQHLERVKPDLVHIDEEPYDFVTFHALRASRRAGAKTLFFTWQNIERRFPPPFSWFESYVLRHTDGAIAGNQAAVGILKGKGFHKPLFTIPQFGVDTEIYRPGQRRDEGIFRIGYVGRLVEEKGILVLLRAVSGLEGHWKLHLVGDGPLKPQIERLVDSLGIASKTYIQASIPSTQIPEYLSQLDVLVLPSLTRPGWKEQFGRVLIEAMACQVPVIGSDAGEIANVIDTAGLVCHEGNVEDLRTQLSRLMADESLRRELVKRGRERVERLYTQKRVAEKTYEAYKAILNITQA
jgi:glycosyltransferase involved in cell wall biosynthesis